MLTLTPSFVFQYEKRMRAIQENEYARALLSQNNYWARIAKTLDVDGASERLTWILNTARIEPVGRGGEMPFSELVTQSTELVPQRYAAATSVDRDQMLDLRAGGLDILADWSMQVGTATAYFPQSLVSEALMNGANTDGSANAYDGVPFFQDQSTTTFAGVAVKGHPYNPYKPALGGYSNWLHGAAGTGGYPGACPIDDSVTLDVAFKNLAKAIAYAKSWKMPDGKTPRFLRPAAIVVPPRMVTQVGQLLDAKFLAQAAQTGGGSGDVTMILQRWGIDSAPIEADELASSTSYSTQILVAKQDGSGQQQAFTETITGSDTSWYLVMEQNKSSQLGGLIHVVREPFKTNYFSGDGGSGMTGVDAILNRALEIEYHCLGRLSVQYGHPYGIMRIDQT